MAAKKALDEAQATLEEAKSKGTKMAEKLTAAYEEVHQTMPRISEYIRESMFFAL